MPLVTKFKRELFNYLYTARMKQGLNSSDDFKEPQNFAVR